MKKVSVFIAIIVMVMKLHADNRATIKLSDYDWLVVKRQQLIEKTSDYPSFVNGLEKIENKDLIGNNNVIITTINIDDPEFNLAAFYLYGTDNLFSVFINGEEIQNELDDGNFYAAITPFTESGSFVLSLQPMHEISGDDFYQFIANAQIALLKGIALNRLSIKKDMFFGGKLLEVGIQNFLDKDVDGKIYARIYDGESQELITENNNCAYSRSGIETLIEVNFPEMQDSIAGKICLAEVEMVDKENNESVVDVITLPVKF